LHQAEALEKIYPKTDDILSRRINLSAGVVDAGLGSAFGIDVDSADE